MLRLEAYEHGLVLTPPVQLARCIAVLTRTSAGTSRQLSVTEERVRAIQHFQETFAQNEDHGQAHRHQVPNMRDALLARLKTMKSEAHWETFPLQALTATSDIGKFSEVFT